ncbi:hypothetical protein CRUP_005643 [Coryphaenoides rupestris]|nr:hypothetical protein CRUP_005643 [Coryphaenoides rupestris]
MTQVKAWHRRAEEGRLQELRQARELEVQREEVGHLKGVVERQERSLCALEEELLWEERQLAVAMSSSSPASFSASSSARASARRRCSRASRCSRWAWARSSCRHAAAAENFSCWDSGSAPANWRRSACTVARAAPPVPLGQVEGPLAGVQTLLRPQVAGLQGAETPGQSLRPALRCRLAELQPTDTCILATSDTSRSLRGTSTWLLITAISFGGPLRDAGAVGVAGGFAHAVGQLVPQLALHALGVQVQPGQLRAGGSEEEGGNVNMAD